MLPSKVPKCRSVDKFSSFLVIWKCLYFAFNILKSILLAVGVLIILIVLKTSFHCLWPSWFLIRSQQYLWSYVSIHDVWFLWLLLRFSFYLGIQALIWCCVILIVFILLGICWLLASTKQTFINDLGNFWSWCFFSAPFSLTSFWNSNYKYIRLLDIVSKVTKALLVFNQKFSSVL